jgi:DHA2 family multidrug resistance protein
MVQTMQFRKQQTHINNLGKYVNPGSPYAHSMVENLSAFFMSQGRDAATATRQAYAAVWGMVQRQAAMLSYDDVFLFLAIMFLVMFPFIFIMKRPKGGGPVMAH